MSWFDASTLSKYSKFAKSALKQAQQNIDKVLDITDDDAAATTGKNTEPISTKTLTSTPISTTAEANHGNNSFFDSFLGEQKQGKQNLHTHSTKAAFSEASNSLQSTPRRDKLKDRSRKKLAEKTNKNVARISINNDTEQELSTPTANVNKLDLTSHINTYDESFETDAISYNSISPTSNDTSVDFHSNHEAAIPVVDDIPSKNKFCDTDALTEQLDDMMVKTKLDVTSVHSERISTNEPSHETNDMADQNKLEIDSSNEDSNIKDADVKESLSNETTCHNFIDEERSTTILNSDGVDAGSNHEAEKCSKYFVAHGNSQGQQDSCIVDKVDVDRFCVTGEDSSKEIEFRVTGEDSSKEIEFLQQEVKRLTDIIEARESKMVVLSKENISLQESVAVYRSQLDQLENTNATDESEMENLRKEFTDRIGETDNKLKLVIKERDDLKQRLAETGAHLTQSANEQISALSQSLIEKENTIQGLLEEGETLSKKELEANNRIKKLRLKMKDLSNKNEAYREKIDNYEKEIESLKENSKEKDANEKKIEGELKKLEGITDSQEDEISLLKDKLDDTEEKLRAVESTLQNAYSEINKLNLEKAQKESEVQEASSAMLAKKELETKLKELEKKSKSGKEELILQLEDMQAALNRFEQQAARREDNLKREIQDLHKRLEEGENRNQELSSSVTAATRPLLRQIESLQSSHASQTNNWERVEKNLTDRLASLQHQLALSSEKERTATEIATELKSKYKALDTYHRGLKEEKIRLEKELDEKCVILKEQEDGWTREKLTLEKQISKLKSLCDGLNKEKTYLEDLLSAEKMKYENEVYQLSSKLAFHQQQQQQQQLIRQSSQNSHESSSIDEIDASDKNVTTPYRHHHGNLSRTNSLYDSMHGSAANSPLMKTTTTASLEHLQSQLRKREGEVFVLKEEIQTLEKTKASLAQELVSYGTKVEELESTSEELTVLKRQYSELESRYSAVLQMYGEKAEEADELRMDLIDYKNMYKQQIEDLLGHR